MARKRRTEKMPKPRDLRELRIDDVGEDAHIRTWKASQQFWSALGWGAHLPDIITCDINFEDDETSPLNRLLSGTKVKKPNGLLYALPFLSIARIQGEPIVLSFHTADPSLWDISDPRTADARELNPPFSLRLLAAEYAGLVLALTEPGQEPLDAEGALRWLMNRHSTGLDYGAARDAALREYRKLLVRRCRGSDWGEGFPPIIVDPIELTNLLAWSEELSGKEEISDEDWENEPGISLIKPSGQRDCLSLRGLFHFYDRFEPELFRAPKDPSGPELANEGWVLEGEAHVGAFIAMLADWSQIYREAVNVIGQVPLPEDEFLLPEQPDAVPVAARTLNALVPADSGGHVLLVRLLVVLFQYVRFWHWADVTWSRSYPFERWDPTRGSHGGFVPGGKAGSGATLPAHLEPLFRKLAKVAEVESEQAFLLEPDEPYTYFSAEPLRQCCGLSSSAKPESVDSRQRMDLYLTLLDSLGLIERQADGRVRVTGARFSQEVPVLPTELYPGFLRSPLECLAATMGHGRASAYQVLRRVPADALFAGDGPKGSRFLADMRSGGLPGWLKELCRIFAREELKWADESRWPDLLL